MASLPHKQPGAETNRAGPVRRFLRSFWLDGNFRKDNFLTNDMDFVPKSETCRRDMRLHLAAVGSATSPIVALPYLARQVINEESRRAAEKFLLEEGLSKGVKLPISIFFALCFGFPIYIAFRQKQWSFALGSITSSPRSLELIFLYFRYSCTGMELNLTFFENRLWINMAPGITFSFTENRKVAAVKKELWFLAVAAAFSATVLLTGVLFRTWLWRGKLQKLRKLSHNLTELELKALKDYSQTLDECAKNLLAMKEERGPGDRRGPEQKGASIPTAEMMDIGVLHSRRILEVIAIFVPGMETEALYPARLKYKYYSVLIVAFILTVGLNYDQFMVIVDAFGKYIWTWIKVRRGVRNTDISPASLGRMVSIIFIETIPSLIMIGILLRASGGTILNHWHARIAIGIVLGLTKTFLADHVLVLFFWVGRRLLRLWRSLGALAIKLHLDVVAEKLGRGLCRLAVMLRLNKIYAVLLPCLTPPLLLLSKGAIAIFG